MKYIVIIFLIMFSACKKEIDVITQNNDCVGGNYEAYSTDNFDFVHTHLEHGSPTGIQIEYPVSYLYKNPVFNPCNPYEIAYTRFTTSNPIGEIWKFSFCTGEATKIADNFYYNLDWGSNGWLLYTGTDHAIYKIKSNGDSLTVLSNEPGLNRAGKWNSSGTLYWNYRDDGTQILTANGDFYTTVETIGQTDWINDSLMLVSAGLRFHSYSITDQNLIQLNTNLTKQHSIAFNIFEMASYVPLSNGIGQNDYFVRYDLSGSNLVDTLSNLYDSYTYVNCSSSSNKIITTLIRQNWRDSTSIVQYRRENLLLMDLDGTNARLLDLP